MAGDWIKVEHATARKPEVSLGAELLGIDRRQMLGLMFDYWIWLDQNLDEWRNGLVTHVSRKSLEDTFHCPGFAAVLERMGWASFDDEARTLCVINWDRHNGDSAKSRALSRERQKRFRNAERNGPVTQTPLPEKRREEKRREDKEQRQNPVRATRLPADWRLPDEWRDWAVNVYHMEPQRAVRISLAFRDFWIAKPGGDGTKLDWYATWRNWVRKEMQDA